MLIMLSWSQSGKWVIPPIYSLRLLSCVPLYRHRRRPDRGRRPGELPAHGPGPDRAPLLREAAGAVLLPRRQDQEALPHAGGRGALGAAAVHGIIRVLFE